MDEEKTLVKCFHFYLVKEYLKGNITFTKKISTISKEFLDFLMNTLTGDNLEIFSKLILMNVLTVKRISDILSKYEHKVYKNSVGMHIVASQLIINSGDQLNNKKTDNKSIETILTK